MFLIPSINIFFFYDPFCGAEKRRKKSQKITISVPCLFYEIRIFFLQKTLNNRKDITIYFWCHQSTKMFFYDPFICVQKRRKKSPQKKITISVQKQFLKLLQPHQGAEPSAGFYILEKVGKRLPPAGSGRKYRLFQLWEYFLWILIFVNSRVCSHTKDLLVFLFWNNMAKGSRRWAVDKNTGCSNF